MRALARFVIRRRRLVLVLSAVALPVAAALGGGVASLLTVGGFADESSESAQAADILAERYPAASVATFVLVVSAESGSVDDPEVVAAGLALTERLGAEPEVVSAQSYWTVRQTVPEEAVDLLDALGVRIPLQSEDSSQGLVLASFDGSEEDALEAAERLSPLYTGTDGILAVQITGAAEVGQQVTNQSEEDLEKAELLTMPITFIALIVVFGSVVAGLLPLAVGVLAVLGTFLALTILTSVTDVSIFSLNLTTALGLGLAIDYSLFMVSRFREELRSGASTEVAISRTMQTAGRTIIFSAGTVTVSLLALLLFPIIYLRSFAYAGVSVVALAAFSAVVVLPALMAALGHRIEKGAVFRRRTAQRRDAPHGEEDPGFWYRQARRVMAHPWPYIGAVTAFLVVLALPFLRLETSRVDDRVLPESASSRVANDEIRENFSSREASALSVFVPGGLSDEVALVAYAREVAGLNGVARVDALTGYYTGAESLPPNELSERFSDGTDDTWVQVVPAVEPISVEGEALVRELRAIETPFAVQVAGPSAELVDTKDSITERLPWALALIGVTTYVLLFFMVGSLLVPLKALVLNLLSLTATFGFIVWVFQDGRFTGILGFTATGTIDLFTPILMFCIAFGLSMDYEVFVLSRIKEHYDLNRDNEEAVAVGLQHTGGIVTAAAVLLAIVFGGIATSEVSLVKMFGIGLTLAVLVDAFLIRATLVPAFMRLAGRANWWAPPALRRFHLRFGVWENEPIAILDQRDGLVGPSDAPTAENQVSADQPAGS